MLRYILSCLFIVVSATAWAMFPGDSIGVTEKGDKSYIIYRVSPGETIWRISTNYHVDISELMEINPALEEEGLKAGQVILIPYDKKAEDDNYVKHKVQPGETYWGLSKKYGMKVEELLRINGRELKAGEELIVGLKDSSAVKAVEKAPVKTPKEPDAPKEVAETEPEKKPEPTPAPKEKAEPAGPFDVVDEVYSFDPNRKQVIVIPFSPYLYFSDADDMIARQSKISRTRVRYVFRNRLNALLDPDGYETIHLLGGGFKDTLTDLNKVYQSISHGYASPKESDAFRNRKESGDYIVQSNLSKDDQKTREKLLDKLQKIKTKLSNSMHTHKDHHNEKLVEKYWAVQVKDPLFYNYFQEKYSADYFIFINQFEISTNFEVCAAVAPAHYDRTFVTHFTILDKDGNKIAGNRFEFNYSSSTNNIKKTVDEAMPYIADRILAEMPHPSE